MRINCDHGYYTFFPSNRSEVYDFNSLFSPKLIAEKDHYVFEGEELAPSHSIAGLPYLSSLAIATFEGDPAAVFRENLFVFNISLGIISTIASMLVFSTTESVSRDCVIAKYLIQAGSRINGRVVTGFNCIYETGGLFYHYDLFYE